MGVLALKILDMKQLFTVSSTEMALISNNAIDPQLLLAVLNFMNVDYT